MYIKTLFSGSIQDLVINSNSNTHSTLLLGNGLFTGSLPTFTLVSVLRINSTSPSA